MEAKEAINDCSKLVAQVLQNLVVFDNLYPNHDEIMGSIELLREVIEKLTNKM